jgi:ABC-type Mn2+/Zn2+ transport system ATPase subunit
MAEPLFRMEGVAIGYGRPILSGISLAIEKGQYWGIFGPNGAGKTTLVKTLLGVLRPLAGSVRRRPGLRLAYVPQLTAVQEAMPLSVRQVVELGALDLKGLPPVSEALLRVGLKYMERERFGDLSGGQRQRLMVARALHRQPQALLLDEPTNGVDLLTRNTLRDLLRELNLQGVTLLLITHLLGEIGPEVGHFLWLDARHGLCLCGERATVLHSPELARAYGGGLKAVDVAGETLLAWEPRGEGRHV